MLFQIYLVLNQLIAIKNVIDSSNSVESITDDEFIALCEVIPVKKKYSTADKIAVVTLFDEVKGIYLSTRKEVNAEVIMRFQKE